MAKNDNLKDFLTDVADAIREKKGTSEPINPQDFSAEIASIETGGGEPIEIIDNLESDRADAALSARQGKELKERIDALPERVYVTPRGMIMGLLGNKEYIFTNEEREEFLAFIDGIDWYEGISRVVVRWDHILSDQAIIEYPVAFTASSSGMGIFLSDTGPAAYILSKTNIDISQYSNVVKATTL